MYGYTIPNYVRITTYIIRIRIQAQKDTYVLVYIIYVSSCIQVGRYITHRIECLYYAYLTYTYTYLVGTYITHLYSPIFRYV